MSLLLTPENTLPVDGVAGTLIGRAWVPGQIAGPSPIVRARTVCSICRTVSRP
jgi:hypothetical protein